MNNAVSDKNSSDYKRRVNQPADSHSHASGNIEGSVMSRRGDITEQKRFSSNKLILNFENKTCEKKILLFHHPIMFVNKSEWFLLQLLIWVGAS